MRILHTNKVRLFQEVTGVEQALVQQIFATFEEAYFTDICNRMTNYINNTVLDMLDHLQDNSIIWCPTSSLSMNASSIRRSTILENQ